jgi:hypothetical protein
MLLNHTVPVKTILHHPCRGMTLLHRLGTLIALICCLSAEMTCKWTLQDLSYHSKINNIQLHVFALGTFIASRKWKAASSKQPTECAYCPLSISMVLSQPWRIVGKRVNQFFI